MIFIGRKMKAALGQQLKRIFIEKPEIKKKRSLGNPEQ
jgi:hypothetical protein